MALNVRCESLCLSGVTCPIRYRRSLTYRIKKKRIRWFRCCYTVTDRQTTITFILRVCLCCVKTCYSMYFRLKAFGLLKPSKVPDRPLGLQEVEASRISRQGGKIVSRTHRPPLSPPQAILLVLISVRSRVDPWAIVRPEGLSQWKSQWPHPESNPRPSDL